MLDYLEMSDENITGNSILSLILIILVAKEHQQQLKIAFQDYRKATILTFFKSY